jgi:hypothetical protein
VQIDGAGVNLVERSGLVHRAHHGSRVGVDDEEQMPGGGPDIDGTMRVFTAMVQEAAPLNELPVCDQGGSYL